MRTKKELELLFESQEEPPGRLTQGEIEEDNSRFPYQSGYSLSLTHELIPKFSALNFNENERKYYLRIFR